MPQKKKPFRRRGRPRKDETAVSLIDPFDSGAPSSEPLSEDTSGAGCSSGKWKSPQEYEASFRLFLFECFKFPDLDSGLHGTLADFLDGNAQDGLYATRDRLIAADPESLPAGTEELPWGIDFNGDTRGVVVSQKGNSHQKLILIPRGHLKSTVIAVAYTVWRIVCNPEIRILLASATATNAQKFIRGVQWQFMQNEAIEELWPHLHVTREQIIKDQLPWTQRGFTVPRNVEYEAGENTAEAFGVGGTLVSRHFDLMICDDLVNDKNTRSQLEIEKTFEWFQNAYSLVDPVDGDVGEVVMLGTRWHYNDLYSSVLSKTEFSDDFSLLFATVVGQDGQPFFPKKFTEGIIEKLRSKQGPFRFSCNYLNQPVDQATAEFQASWLGWYTNPPDPRSTFDFGVLDPAFTEKDGDATSLVVFSIDETSTWYIRRIWKIRVGNLPQIMQIMLEAARLFPNMTLGIEARGFQKIISQEFRLTMVREGVNIAIRELKTESNRNKRARIMRLAPRFQAGKIKLLGLSVERADPNMKSLVDEYLRFPRGHDDVIDALAYGIDIAYAPQRGAEWKPPTHQQMIDEQIREKKFNRRDEVDEHLGSEW